MMGRNRILFVSLANDIGSERVVAAMARQSMECAVLSPSCFYAALTSYCKQCFPLPNHFGIWERSLATRRRLENAVKSWQPAIVLPLDDVAARLLRGLALDHRVSEPVRKLLVKSLGDPQGYQASITRRGLMELADQLNLRKPTHKALHGLSDLGQFVKACGFPIVHKLENTCGGSGVTIIRDKDDLETALHPKPLLKRLRAACKTALKRRLEIVAGFPAGAKHSDISQSFVDGKPAMCSVAAWNGKVLGMLSLAAERIYPENTGASTIVSPIDNEEMRQTATKLVRALGCHGFVSFDFVVDQQGRAYLIEMNARAVGTMHLSAVFGTDICALLAEELGGTKVERAPARNRQLSVALFPKELLRDPVSPYLEKGNVIHDIPWDDAPMIDVYMNMLRAAHAEYADEMVHAVSAGRSTVKEYALASALRFLPAC